jgi:hypothetical protein
LVTAGVRLHTSSRNQSFDGEGVISGTMDIKARHAGEHVDEHVSIKTSDSGLIAFI